DFLRVGIGDFEVAIDKILVRILYSRREAIYLQPPAFSIGGFVHLKSGLLGPVAPGKFANYIYAVLTWSVQYQNHGSIAGLVIDAVANTSGEWRYVDGAGHKKVDGIASRFSTCICYEYYFLIPCS